MSLRTTFTLELDARQANKLEAWLKTNGYEFRVVPHARFAAGKRKVNVVFYQSGKLVVQGPEASEFVEFVLEPVILQQARIGYEAVLNPELLWPRIGVDESGKGDFFGPLCIAAVYVNESVIDAWKDAGIRDSKRIGSDRQVIELARLIRSTPGCVFSVVPVGNPAYNRLHANLGNVNRILAWGHARAIENLLLQRHRLDPPPVRVISDQFAANTATLKRALMELGRTIELVQRHRAEADIAVAAASILARDAFVAGLCKLEKKSGIALPKGASAAVDSAARAFVEKHGLARLSEVAKTHFQNARRIASPPDLTEPIKSSSADQTRE